MFITITNANFDDDAILDEIKAGLKLREELKALATDEEKKEAENMVLISKIGTMNQMKI